MKSSEPIDFKGFDVAHAEPYIEDDGSPAVAMVWNGAHLRTWTISEWKRQEPEIGRYLENIFFKLKHRRWKYPGKPIMPEEQDDIRRLQTAIMRRVDQHIDFPNSAWPSVFATWIIGSYLVPWLDRSPILPIFGPTGSGKGQVLDMVDRLAYRGKKMISPTPAILYRLADRWNMTFALDELQDLNAESKREVMCIIKGAYDGTPVSRCDSNNEEVLEFQTRGFMALSFKVEQPAEDVKNRGILLTMRRNGTPKQLVPDDSEEFMELRARLMGLLFKMMTDQAFREDALKNVQEQASPDALGFDRRPRDIAAALLLPAILSGSQEELIEVIKNSSAEAKEEDNSTFTAQVQYTYEELLRGLSRGVRYFPVLTIRSRLQDEMQADGDLRDNQKLKTRAVTNALKGLGYIVRHECVGGHNPSIDLEERQNKDALETNRVRYHIEDILQEAG